jgi:hypothetical protein
VLTGTPIENRIDELRSIVDFLDPALLGSLFRFNREFYRFDDKGRPEGYQNLDRLRARVRPVLLRRRKADVETQPMRDTYAEYERQVAELVQKSHRRPLTPKEQDLLMILMNMMRMICDTPAIIKNNPCHDCPKLDELARILDEVLADPDVKVIIFSEWEGMLERVREHALEQGIGFAWHTGSVPQQRRRAEIVAFRQDTACRLFLSTDSGGVGLNLQHASVVINCDLPWNPAKLEQRIARAWRKNQLRPVTVVNLVAEKTLEHGMLETLASKQELAAGVLDGVGDLTQVPLKRGRQDMLKRLEQALAVSTAPSVAPAPATFTPPSDPAVAFALAARRKFGARLVHCDEMWPAGSDTPVLLAVLQDSSAEHRPALEAMFHEAPWRGSPPWLRIVDASTWATLQEFAATGLVTLQARATRSLLDGDAGAPPSSLSSEERARIDALLAVTHRKVRAARALLSADLADEALPALREAALARAQAAEMGCHRPAPATLAEALRPPGSSAWPDRVRAAIAALDAGAVSSDHTAMLLDWMLQK